MRITGSVGSSSYEFIVTTRAGTTTPAAFSFQAVTGRERSVLADSNEITLSGFELPVPIRVEGGLYSINGGTFTNTPGTVRLIKKFAYELPRRQAF